jgi:hypothetical protein
VFKRGRLRTKSIERTLPLNAEQPMPTSEIPLRHAEFDTTQQMTQSQDDGTFSGAVELGDLQTIQREVQRKFGRNLLLLQQYERLMKWLVAEQDIAGPMGELERIKGKQIQAVSKKTLGQVVGDLTGNFIAPALPEGSSEQEAEHASEPNKPWIRISFRMEMQAEDFKETERKLAELVALRNDLAHHFLESYDIWTELGCQIASTYLDECFKKIEAHYEELRQMAQHSHETRKEMASFAQTPEFMDFFIHGIFPGGAGVAWSSCTIVNLLRDAEDKLVKDGWTFLQDAIDYVLKAEPEHIPAKYGCSSWRQVLHESAQFEVRKEKPKLGQSTPIWYRSK